jgi:hypothetical protein
VTVLGGKFDELGVGIVRVKIGVLICPPERATVLIIRIME